MKKLVPAYILSFTICFMLLVIEPLVLYASNIEDFNFNLGHFILPLFISFILFFVAISLFYTIIYFINKKISSKLTFFNVILIISYILFILFYIQGNYLIGSLPRLDGTTPDWSIYGTENLITIIIFLIIVTVYVICLIKYKFEKVINVSNYITLAILVMVFSGFVPTLFNNNLYESRKSKFVSNDNINELSKEKNFIIIVLDMVDSQMFNNILDEGLYNDTFNDFTYFKDSISTYPYTRDSIPNILSGKINYNETSFSEFYNDAMDNSPLIKKLTENNYEINLYEEDLKWNTDLSNNVKNIVDYNEKFSAMCYIKTEAKFLLYKYLPYFLKQYSNMETFNLNYCKKESNANAFDDDNTSLYNVEIDNLIDNNYFSFIHIEGGHVPFDLDENMNRISDGTYKQKVLSALKTTDTYIQKLKDKNLYDNSIIIVMSDHGYDFEEGMGRQNPMLLIKGFDEHHEMVTSDKKISYQDLIDAYIDLMDGKQSSELFKDITNERKRVFINYAYLSENTMVEVETEGKAWEIDKYKNTGRVFKR